MIKSYKVDCFDMNCFLNRIKSSELLCFMTVGPYLDRMPRGGRQPGIIAGRTRGAQLHIMMPAAGASPPLSRGAVQIRLPVRTRT